MQRLVDRRESAEGTSSLPGGLSGASPRRRRHRHLQCAMIPAVPLLFLGIVFFFWMLGARQYTEGGVPSTEAPGPLTPEQHAGRAAAAVDDLMQKLRADMHGRRRSSWTSSPPYMHSATVADKETRLREETTTTTARPTTTLPPLRVKVPGAVEGEYEPERPDRLPGLSTKRRTYTSAELLARHAASDYIYTFANGTEANHHYRKQVRLSCLTAVLAAEKAAYRTPPSRTTIPSTAALSMNPTETADVTGMDDDARAGETLGAVEELGLNAAAVQTNPYRSLGCTPSFMESPLRVGRSLGGFLYRVRRSAEQGGADNRDRETDELRHSIRSVEQHVRWHRGRVVIVSPGHYPTWVDAAKNFLAGRCGDKKVQALRESGTHLRLTTVHQDALMPDGERLTSNSHVIEEQLWRVRNITPVHVYMNDDYFVNRDVAITDLFNEYGGTIVRTEATQVLGTGVGDDSPSWQKGVTNTNLFNVREIDVHPEDYLPPALPKLWKANGRLCPLNLAASVDRLSSIAVPPLEEAIDVANMYPPEPLDSLTVRPRRHRYYTTHAPFVYCTNMFRFFSTRYEREFAAASLHHRGRRARDLFLPFLYNAFIMARPWQASPRFLPYLLELQRHRVLGMMDTMPKLAIELDNMDGCAPATLNNFPHKNGCVYATFSNKLSKNTETMSRIDASHALYFNINAGFNSQEASDQLRAFLHDKFPNPTYLEAPMVAAESPAEEDDAKYVNLSGESSTPSTTAPPVVDKKGDASMTRVFDALMALPVVGLVSYDEGACPLVRSLALAFVDRHQGPVRVVVQRHSDEGEEEVSLAEARTTLQNRIYSAMPVPQCAFASHVTVQAAPKSATVADMVGDALESTVANSTGKVAVELPSTCGESGAGLRVRGFVVDARTPGAPVMSRATLREALAVPGQTLALEDFRVVTVGPGPRDVVLVLAREDAAAKAVHWVTGGAENDLLVTYPLPVPAYEDMSAPLKWSQP